MLGSLPIYTTSTGFVVTPVVGLVGPGFALQPDPNEVAEVFEVPLAFFLDAANLHRRRIDWRGKSREIFDFPFEGKNIWGATAAMLLSLVRRLEATK